VLVEDVHAAVAREPVREVATVDSNGVAAMAAMAAVRVSWAVTGGGRLERWCVGAGECCFVVWSGVEATR
jgi:hypothetical protein